MRKLSRIYIEITNVCNLKCSFCIGNVRPQKFMTIAEFEYILTQIKPFTDYIYLHVLGEPLLHPQLNNILLLAERENIKVNITTNGTLIKEKQEMLLNSANIRKISISLHSLEGNLDINEYLKNILSFVTLAAEKGILCDLRLWNINAQGAENKAIFENIAVLLNLDAQTQENIKSKIIKVGNSTLAPNIFLGTANQFQWPSMKAPLTNKPIFCYGLRKQAAILCDGTVTPCCLDSVGDIPLGNIFKKPFEEILNGERATQLYNGFSQRKPTEELCRRCGYATRF